MGPVAARTLWLTARSGRGGSADGCLRRTAACPASSATVAVASGHGPLYATTDAGASWTPVQAPSAAWTYLVFTDATHGVAIGLFGDGRKQVWRLYYTTDAGASYHYVPIGP